MRYTDALKEATIHMLTSWKLIPEKIREMSSWWRYAKLLFIDIVQLILFIFMPFLVFLSPLLAWVMVRSERDFQRQQKEFEERMKHRSHWQETENHSEGE